MQGINIAGVQFVRSGKIYDFSYQETELTIGDHVLVETEKGINIAQVARLKFAPLPNPKDKILKPILRKASAKELQKEFRLTADEISQFTHERIEKLELKMKILKSEIQHAGNKIIIFFSAPGRVDFRELVKELASGLKTRVELKQVGARDETKILGGMGICGREYCCSSFLREFVPVSIKMAKHQNLALNPQKVSGGCGRLLCCLTYENEVYKDLRQSLPSLGSEVEVKETGLKGRVVKADLLNQKVILDIPGQEQQTYKVDELIVPTKSIPPRDFDDQNLQKEIVVSGEELMAAEDWGQDIDLDALEAFVQENDRKKKENIPHQNRNRSQQNQRSQRPQQQSNGQSRPNKPEFRQNNDRPQKSHHKDNNRGPRKPSGNKPR